jgi:hypothetical protein
VPFFPEALALPRIFLPLMVALPLALLPVSSVIVIESFAPFLPFDSIEPVIVNL